MSHYKPYPAYKDSGVEWIGKVPEHWEVLRLANIGSLVKGNGGTKADDAEDGMPCIRYGDLYTTYDLLIHKIKKFIQPESAPDYTQIKYGDLLLAASGETFEEIGKSAVNLDKRQAVCGGDVIILRPVRKIDPTFLGYAAGSVSAQAQKSLMGKGFTVIHVYGDSLRNLTIASPPDEEQKQIGVVIDRETARIDALIAKKTEFIELLAKKRQSLITHAVTKGLNPKAKMKESGVEWIGEVPEHWQVRPIKSIATGPATLFIDGDWIESKNLSDSGIRYITTGNVGEGDYKEQGSGYISEATFNDLRCTEVLPGDVLVSRLNPPIGRACIAPNLKSRVVTSVDNVILRPSADFDPMFIVFRFSAKDYFHEMRLLGSGATMQRVSRTELGNVRIAWPPLKEQIRIARNLKAATTQLNTLSERVGNSIDLLKKRRSALITAAVTGQIDLRESA